MTVIDFARARIAWTTHDGSRGLWRVVAVARETGGARRAWYLAAGVMAGDVYGQGRLPLQPPYSFQFAASRERHVMFRQSIEASGLQDTDASHSDTFSSIAIDAPEIEAGSVRLDGVAADGRWPLTARLSVDGASGARWSLEFPVGHINLRDEPAAWQIETGPVIVPVDLMDIVGAAKPGGLQLAFLFVNRADRADLLALGPLSGSDAGRRGFAHFARLEGVEVELFGQGVTTRV